MKIMKTLTNRVCYECPQSTDCFHFILSYLTRVTALGTRTRRFLPLLLLGHRGKQGTDGLRPIPGTVMFNAETDKARAVCCTEASGGLPRVCSSGLCPETGVGVTRLVVPQPGRYCTAQRNLRVLRGLSHKLWALKSKSMRF